MTKLIAGFVVCFAVLLVLQIGNGRETADAQDNERGAAQAEYTEHVAREGDSWWKLAHKTYRDRGLSSNEIANANPGKRLVPGNVVLIPPGRDAGDRVARPTPKPASKDLHTGIRLVRAEQGDTAYSLSVQYYGERRRFRDIVKANPSLKWAESLSGGEYVLLPAVATETESETTE